MSASSRALPAMSDGFKNLLTRAFFDLRPDEIAELADLVRRGADVLERMATGNHVDKINARLGAHGETVTDTLREIAPRVRS